MKKIAVLVSGDYRVFDITSRTMLFLKNPDVDIYFSTWYTSEFKIDKMSLHRIVYTSEDHIKSVVNRSVNIVIENIGNNYKHLRYNSHMIYRWQAGLDLIKKSGIKYDYIMVLRPDLAFNIIDQDLKFFVKYEDSVGFVWQQPDTVKLQDICFVSTYDNISNIISHIKIDDWNSSKEGDWHTWFYKHVTGLGIKISNLDDFECTIARTWSTINSTYQELCDIHFDWRDVVIIDNIDTHGLKYVIDTWGDEIVNNAILKWNTGYFERYKNG